MNRFQLLRLGLFQLAAGAVSVIFLGVVNRVMRVELGIDLFTVSVLVGGGHYLGALVAIPFGHYSDSHTVFGYRRSVYALSGAILTALILAVSPFVVTWLAQNQTPINYSLAFLFFLLEGVSTFIAGTAYLSLITDLTTEKERGSATGVVWTLLMVGIIFTGISTGLILKTYSFNSFLTLTLIGAGLSVALVVVALLNQERRAAELPSPSREAPDLKRSLQLMIRSSQARWFAGFLVLGMFSFFMQDAVLEPFGGEVFRLEVAQTTRFNAYLGVGVILGMVLGGAWLIPRFGKPIITGIGCALMTVAFALLAVAALGVQASLLSVAITALGFGSGLFTVGGVALMMDMTSSQQTGLFVGAWTLVQAVAKGPAAIAGGAIQSSLLTMGLTAAQAYSAVFIVEAVGMALSIFFLSRVGVKLFKQEVESLGNVLAQVVD